MPKRTKRRRVIPTIAIGGLALAVLGFSAITTIVLGSGGTPLFNTTESFVLFGEDEVELERDVQVSSGDIGSNEEIGLEKRVIVNGNLFSDEIELDKNVQINGNVSFNELETKKGAQILGEQTTPVSLPIADIQRFPNSFPIGNESFKFRGDGNTLPSGDYRDITIKKDATLTLTGGIYNIRKLRLKKNSTLIFSSTVVINVKEEFKGSKNIAILPGTDVIFDGLQINLQSEKKKKKKTKSIKIGRNSFLSFKLFAPKSKVKLKRQTTLRGQIVANKIEVGRESVLSRNITTSLQPQPKDIVVTEEGAQFVINQIILQLTSAGTANDAIMIARSINGSVVGIVPSINLYQIAVRTTTIEELDALIQQLLSEQNSIIKNVSKNVILNLID